MSISLRERNRLTRRAALTSAAQELALARGLDGVTVEDICAQVDLSPRTFFNYFATKEDAVLGLHGEKLPVDLEVLVTFLDGGPSGDLLADGAVLIENLMASADLDPARLVTIIELVQREPRLLGRHVAWIEAQREELERLITRREETSPSGVDPAISSNVIASLVRAVGLRWSQQGCTGAPGTHLPTVLDQVRRLVAPSERENS